MKVTRALIGVSILLAIASLAQLGLLNENSWESATLAVCAAVSAVCGVYFWRSR